MNKNKKIDSDTLKLLDYFSDWYIQKSEFDCPVKDAAQIIALFLATKKNESSEIVYPEFPDGENRCFIDYISDYAFEIHPTLGRDEWEYLLSKTLSRKYGGEKFYIKSDPAAEFKQAAKSMTAQELMNKFGISRGYAYKLRSTALKSKNNK